MTARWASVLKACVYTAESKSLFASFSSEKEETSFLKERSKELLVLGVVFTHTGLGRIANGSA
jgi:hypothetical protein